MSLSEHEFVPYRAERSLAVGPVLVLAPHPDDEVFGCGGAIMRHIEAGDPVRTVIVTDGAFGRGSDRDAHARERQLESRRAAAVLGYDNPLFWGLPDRGLEYGEPLIGRILDAIENMSARLVYAPSWWEIHPDHLVLALATAEAARRCPRPILLAMYEVGVPLHPNRLLDITDVQERKQEAMACFASQLARQDYDRHVAALDTFRTYTLPMDVRAAEGYRVLTNETLREPPWASLRPAPGRTLADLARALRTAPDWDEIEMARGLTARLQAQREEIEELRRSTSWRITAPLRWLVSRVRTLT